MIKGVISDQNRGQMSSGVLKASDRQRNFIKREMRVKYQRRYNVNTGASEF
jgi:hypothetical protein